jgi:hypothetical protein
MSDNDLADVGTALELAEAPHSSVELPGPELWGHMQRIAYDLAGSNLVKAALRGKPDDVLLVLLYGRDLGLSPTTALAKIHVIEGLPSLSAEMQAALIRRAGHRLDGTIVRDDKQRPVAAEVSGVRADSGEAMSADFTISDAVAAGLCTIDDELPNGVRARSNNGGKPKPWEAHTSDMLWARAVSRLARRLFPDVLSGVTYTPEELAPDYVWASGRPNPTEVEPMTDDQRERLNTAMKALDSEQKGRVAAELRAANERGDLPPREMLGAAHVQFVFAIIEDVLRNPAPEPDPDPNVADAELVDDGPTDDAPPGVGVPVAVADPVVDVAVGEALAEPDPARCPLCDGAGVTSEGGPDPSDSFTMECFRCDGSGRIDPGVCTICDGDGVLGTMGSDNNDVDTWDCDACGGTGRTDVLLDVKCSGWVHCAKAPGHNGACCDLAGHARGSKDALTGPPGTAVVRAEVEALSLPAVISELESRGCPAGGSPAAIRKRLYDLLVQSLPTTEA